MLLNACFGALGDSPVTFVIDTLQSSGYFKQKYEDLMLKYLAGNWRHLGEHFVLAAAATPSLFKYLIAIVGRVAGQEQMGIFFQVLPRVPVEQLNQSSAFTVLEVELSYLLLLKGEPTRQFLEGYLPGLVERAFDVRKTIDIHREALLLYGLYLKRCD